MVFRFILLRRVDGRIVRVASGVVGVAGRAF
jgi:hypothetical protein